ncbi:MAG: LysM peptidoglycan-binding domain-containing protein, partial [Methylococcales bacterium]|nr:LysM peptidoglycan-binding domain-containing protein [Methylococcales bacterium]
VKKNETLRKISAKYRCSYLDIARWNNIPPPYKIVLGQKLSVSKHAPTAQKSTVTHKRKIKSSQKSATGSRLYLVKAGDTLYSIGRHFKINHKKIIAVNNLTLNNKLKAGQKLKIPNNKQKDSKKKIAKNATAQTRNMRFRTQKTSIISNDNENMLKFYCQWPIAGKIERNFSRTGKKGIEIRGYIGQKVNAVANGTVVAVNSSIYGHGKYVVIKHNNQYMSSYANNQRTLVRRGQKIKKGQLIAELGKIGYKPPLLKFEIISAGRSVNPLYFLPKR